MPDREQQVVDIKDFPGLIVSLDPRDLPPGAAQEQVNVACIVQGELRVRMGIRQVYFDE